MVTKELYKMRILKISSIEAILEQYQSIQKRRGKMIPEEKTSKGDITITKGLHVEDRQKNQRKGKSNA
jgi:hypothetical protein